MNPEVWNHDTIRGFKALITQLAGQAKDRTFNAQEIANIYNALSKWVNNDNIFVFKTLITQLVDQAKDRTFNAQGIANIYNALSKWVNNDNIFVFKALITQLADQAKDQIFNAQGIANIYNALSKWVNNDNIVVFKTLITQLADQAKDQTFNAQGIANICNALSKWINNDNIDVFKTLITQLVDQAKDRTFGAQGIATIYNALSKFDILSPEVWNHDTIRRFKALITQLTRQAQVKDFNAQDIANIYNALSKWVDTDIWRENENVFKTLITQLADQTKGRTFNAQGIANIYNALSKWVNNDNIVVFKTLITQLAGQAEGKDFDAQNIANIYNALSKFDILNPEIWNHPNTIQGFKALIIKLSNQAQVKDFNAQGIANIYNALTKFNILNTEVWNHDTIRGFKAFITRLARQAQVKDFNDQDIANIYNALSKWVDTDIWHKNENVFKTLIAQLASQTKERTFNAQNIANIYNALSKFDVLNAEVWNHDTIRGFKAFIAQLAGQARDKNFSAQDIANIYNALSKWVDTDIWRENENVFKTLITQLAGQAKDRTFNVQNIANIYNALSKWVNNDNIVVFKTLITQLARQAQVKDFNAQDIANIYKALSKYPKSFIEENKTVFQDLVKVLAVQVINAKQFQKRSSASVIRDLPKLANLIADNYPLKNLLISLMRSFTHREYQNRLTDLSGYFSEESCWTTAGIKDLAESIQKLNLSDNDKEELEIAFNDDIPKILNRLARFRLNSYKLTSILEGVTKLISSGVANNNDDIIQPLNKLFGNLKRYGDGNKLTPETLEFLKAIPHKEVPESHVAKKDLKLTITNIVEENAAESKRYNLPEDLERFKEEVLKPQGIEYISEDKFRNLKVFVAEVRVLGRNQWGIYAGESIEAGKFLGTYDGERMSSKNADRDRKDSAYLFDVSKSITIDASRRRNWAAYVNYGTSGTANVNSGSSGGRSKQIELRAYETVPVNHQLLLDYGDNYFTNVDYSPIYLHPTDNWKTPKEHYDEHKAIYGDQVIQLPNDMAKNLGLKQKYIAATKLFQAVRSGQDIHALLLNPNIVSAIDMPSYSLEFTSGKKWKFSEYDTQQNITPLMLACYLGKEAEVVLLLANGADSIRRTLYAGHNALFLAVLSNAESDTKENVLDKLVGNAIEVLKKKSDAFYDFGYDKPSNYDKLLRKDLSEFLQLTDASGSNIFDHMMDKGEYKLWKKYFNSAIDSREERGRIAEKFISDKGIFSIIASVEEDTSYKEIIEILLGTTTQDFIHQHLQDFEQSGEIDFYNTETKQKILTNLHDLDLTNKKGKIVIIVEYLLFNEVKKIKEKLSSEDAGIDMVQIRKGTRKIKERFSKVLEHLGNKNKLDIEINAINRLIDKKVEKISGCLQPGRKKREVNKCISWENIKADEYVQVLRELSTQEQISFAQENKAINFEGSIREIKSAEKVRDLLLSYTDPKLYEINKLLESPEERRIKNLYGDASQSINPKLQQLMNAAGRIQLLRGIHSTFASCESGGLSTDCMLSVGEMGYSFLSQPIENSVLKITPKVVQSAASIGGKMPGILGENARLAVQLKGGKFGAPIARGVGGAISGIFDVVDIGMSAETLINCANRREKGEHLCEDKEIRDSIAAISFSGVSFISGIALTAAGVPGAGTLVGLALMIGQGVYSGVSNIIEYKKYDTTHDENWRIFWHTFAFQPIPEDIKLIEAKIKIINQLAEQAWRRLEKSTDDVVAIAMGLGELKLKRYIVPAPRCKRGVIGFDPGRIQLGSHYERSRHPVCNIERIKSNVYPSHANIIMNETNADTGKLARIIPKSPSVDAQMLGLPKGIPPICNTNHEAIYECDNAFVIANKTRIANYNKNQTIIFDLSYVNQGKIVGSERKNVFLIDGGRGQIFGGDNTENTFHLMNKAFSGCIHGGNSARNLLNLSNLNSSRISYDISGIHGAVFLYDQQISNTPNFITEKINRVIGAQDRREDINCKNSEEILINGGGGNNNDQKDLLINCKKAVIWPYTDITGSGGGYIFYIKLNKINEDVGRSEIDIDGSGTLIFLETALLNDCNKIIYSSNSNILSFEIPLDQGKTFILDVKNYLNQDKIPNFHLIDKHGSNIVPVIRESDLGKDSIEIKSFRLNAEEVFTNSEEDEVWYRSISQSHQDYQVFGIINDKQTQLKQRVFGSSGVDIINLNLDKEIIFVHGGNGSDVYINDNVGNKTIVIDNCAEDQELDVLLMQQNSLVARQVENDLHLYYLLDEGESVHREIKIRNYFEDFSCQHLIIKGENMLVPFGLQTIHLVPFYHASNNENVFLLPENSTDLIIINARMGDTKFYKYKDDLLLIREENNNTTIPLTIIGKGFYSDQSKWQSVNAYFWNKGEISSVNLSQKAAEAVSYEDKIRSDYEKIIKEYVYSNTFSGNIAHNQEELENGTLSTIAQDKRHIGVLIFKDVNPSRIGLAYSDNDLIFFDKVDHKNLTIRNWNISKDHRISTIEFDLESGRVVIHELDKFSCDQTSSIQSLIKKAELQNIANQELEQLNTDTVNGVRYLLSVRGIENGVDAHKILGFDSMEDQKQFILAYHSQHNKEKLLQYSNIVEAILWLIVKGYSELPYNPPAQNAINAVFGPILNNRTTNFIGGRLETETVYAIATGVKRFIRGHKEALVNKILSSLENLTEAEKITISDNSTEIHLPQISYSRQKRYIKTPISFDIISEALFRIFGVHREILLAPKQDDIMENLNSFSSEIGQEIWYDASEELEDKLSQTNKSPLQINQESVTSRASKPQSWINAAVSTFTNAIVSAAQGVSQLISSPLKTSLPSSPTLSSQKESFKKSSSPHKARKPGNQYTAQFSSDICVQSNVNLALFYGQNNANSSLKGQQVTSGANKLSSTNSGSRPSSWITNFFGRVKNSIVGFIAPSKEQVNSNIVQPEISSAFVDGFLILSDVGVRKFTGNKYKQPKHDSLLSPKELIERRMDYTAINAINNFEKVCDDRYDNDFQNATNKVYKPMTCLNNLSLANTRPQTCLSDIKIGNLLCHDKEIMFL